MRHSEKVLDNKLVYDLRVFLALVLAVGSLALAGCTHSGREAASADEPAEEQQRFDNLLRQVRSEYAVPALAAAVVRNGEIFAAAVGVRRVDQVDSVRLDDDFHIGSVSKPVSATVIATLVEDGSLSWGSTVATVFPDLVGRIDPVYLDVTVEQLLSHRAGIVPWEEDEEIASAPAVTGSPRQQRRASLLWLLNQAPVAAPGTAHVYSNAGYMVAASMAEEVTGVEWEELVRQRLAEPLGLHSLGFGWPARADSAQPWGHRASAGGFTPHPPHDTYQAGPMLAPAGDIHMNIMDLARFAQLHLEGLEGRGRLLSPQTFEKLHDPVGDYALGWNVRDAADHHLGGLETFLAAIWVSVPRNVAIVVATNADADTSIVSATINGSLEVFNVPKP